MDKRIRAKKEKEITEFRRKICLLCGECRKTDAEIEFCIENWN